MFSFSVESYNFNKGKSVFFRRRNDRCTTAHMKLPDQSNGYINHLEALTIKKKKLEAYQFRPFPVLSLCYKVTSFYFLQPEEEGKTIRAKKERMHITSVLGLFFFHHVFYFAPDNF